MLSLGALDMSSRACSTADEPQEGAYEMLCYQEGEGYSKAEEARPLTTMPSRPYPTIETPYEHPFSCHTFRPAQGGGHPDWFGSVLPTPRCG